MCGIAGFSLSPSSTIKPRELSNALLTELDIRGNQASGYAFRSPTSFGLFKQPVAGASLSLKSMSRNAKQVLLHTRYATHGSIKTPANNHPVESPDKSIALVHNGVIYNHDLVRTALKMALPEVDTSVIPAILQKYKRDTDKFSMLDGDAAIGWLDRDDPTMTMWVARISHSPLQIAQLADGSFIFASTEAILLNALDRLDLTPVYCEPVPERTLLGIRDGRMDFVQALPQLDPAYQDTAWYDYGRYRGMTSGGHQSFTLGSPSARKPKPYSYDYQVFDDEYWDDSFSTTTTSSGSDLTPKYVAVQSAWGDVLIPEDWYGDNPNNEFPTLENLVVNEYGEYFDPQGNYVGSVDDLREQGRFGEWVLEG